MRRARVALSCVVRESNLISPRCTFKIGRRASRTACRRRASHDNLVTTAPTKNRLPGFSGLVFLRIR
ncbi:DUF1534 domain-containing protein [Pseudomonas syringae pv. actinidiae]|nr:DUF1534 domain-containing protein [Pseudomonas syringae pv. actinidiae]AYL80415.1 DUF1534 domain-containing protein [Pseudomonas syringae pv. actinidiae str. Shaanxi_M228]